MTTLRKNTFVTNPTDDVLQFIMSDGTKDRYGDVIVAAGWNLVEFLKNPIALANHDPTFIVGTWYDVHTEGETLLGRLKMAALGTSARIDELRKLVYARILVACSVGFSPDKSMPLPNGGVRYEKQTLIECSLVSTPANPNAVMNEAKALGISNNVIERVIGRPPKDASLAQRQAFARARLNQRTLDEAKQKREQDAEFRKRMIAMDKATRRDLALARAFEKSVEAGLAVMTKQYAEDEARARKRANVSELVRTHAFEKKFRQLVAEGADPQALMNNFLARLR